MIPPLKSIEIPTERRYFSRIISDTKFFRKFYAVCRNTVTIDIFRRF